MESLTSEESSALWYESMGNINRYVKSPTSIMRTVKISIDIREFCGSRLPSAFDMLEYSYKLIKKRGYTPHRFNKTIKYFMSVVPLTGYMPVCGDAIVSCPFLFTQQDIDMALSLIEKQNVKAYVAVCLSGVVNQKAFINTLVGEYDEKTGIIREMFKLPAWAKVEVDKQKAIAIESGLANEDFLFFEHSKLWGITRMSMNQYNKAKARILARTGLDINRHGYLAMQLRGVTRMDMLRYRE